MAVFVLAASGCAAAPASAPRSSPNAPGKRLLLAEMDPAIPGPPAVALQQKCAGTNASSTAADQPASIHISSDNLIRAYSEYNNPDRSYEGNIVEVTGIILSVHRSDQRRDAIRLGPEINSESVTCYFDDSLKPSLEPGQTVRIRGLVMTDL